MQKILLIDRDGTLVKEPDDFQVDALHKIQLCDGVIPALLDLIKAGFRLVMISNQDGLGTARFPQNAFQICHDFILQLLASQGIHFDCIFICPHFEEDNCSCRKPKTGLLDDYLQQYSIDLMRSWVIGDRPSDQQLAENLGVSFLPVSESNPWPSIAQTVLTQLRFAKITRQTKETAIKLMVSLDSQDPSKITTPIPFFTHMLEQVATHGGFSLTLDATGDVDVDDHHLIEDTALALGDAIKQALGNKWGITRFGFTLPMDESLASLAIDVCGRSFCSFQAPFTREWVGGMATEMVPHFFKSFADSLGATLHIKVDGENHHHMIEACFKALGRALRQAFHKTGNNLPSTKGIL
jgi:imidazoleglycerol-phosphate dehydratase/histidinol-phosphatase